jgi:hypothetical protein
MVPDWLVMVLSSDWFSVRPGMSLVQDIQNKLMKGDLSAAFRRRSYSTMNFREMRSA